MGRGGLGGRGKGRELWVWRVGGRVEGEGGVVKGLE